MSVPTSDPTREDVLDAFAVEEVFGRETLERYLRDYPQFAMDLVDLSRELSRATREDEGPLSAMDEAAIEAAWKRHVEAAPKVITDPFEGISVDQLRSMAKQLDVPRQVITAFRERRVDIPSVPRRFLAKLAASMNAVLEQLVIALSSPLVPSSVRSYKADEKPLISERVSFDQILTEAGVSKEKRASLLSEHD